MQADLMTIECKHAWAAGFFDGEGSISLLRNRSKTCASPTFSLKLRLSQAERGPLDEWASIFGGSVHYNHRERVKGGQHVVDDYYDLWLTGHRALLALHAMLPYLTLKKERAQLAIAFREHVEARPNNGSRRLPPEEVEFGWDCYHRMKELNVKPKIVRQRRAAATTERAGIPTADEATVWTASMAKMQTSAEMTDASEGR